MGKKNSSKTRVDPVFRSLYERDGADKPWLPRLLKLPIGGRAISLPLKTDFTIKEMYWGANEKKLQPPLALLSWLIRHPRKPSKGSLSKDPAKARKRKEWIGGSQDRILEGLRLLRNNPKGEDWHLFEGKTQPDVFIETPHLLIVIEGKRTEREPTTSTKWMPVRHQMLRHLDGAWEIAAGRSVIGFFIVEGEDGVTKNTTILVVGDQDVRKLAGQEKSSKHRKAEDLIKKGQAIRIIRETDFKELVDSSL